MQEGVGHIDLRGYVVRDDAGLSLSYEHRISRALAGYGYAQTEYDRIARQWGYGVGAGLRYTFDAGD